MLLTLNMVEWEAQRLTLKFLGAKCSNWLCNFKTKILPSKLMIGTLNHDLTGPLWYSHFGCHYQQVLITLSHHHGQVILDYLNDQTFLTLVPEKKTHPNCLCSFTIMFQFFQWNMCLPSTYVWQCSTWWVSMVL